MEIDFSNTEWMSDSLEVKDESQWREFVFIDSTGKFTRTTWWNQRYVLDKGELIDKIVKAENGNYQIEIIDSFNIKISKLNYVGFFHGNPWKENKNFKSSLNSFIIGDSMKEMMIGNWEYESHELKLAEHFSLDEEFSDFAKNKLERVGALKIINQPKLKITKDNEFIISDSLGNQIEYLFMIDDKAISIRRSDYIITLGYEFDKNGNLIIVNKLRVGEANIKMKKMDTATNKS